MYFRWPKGNQMANLVLFPHGLNGDSETWQTIPDLIRGALGKNYRVEPLELAGR